MNCKNISCLFLFFAATTAFSTSSVLVADDLVPIKGRETGEQFFAGIQGSVLTVGFVSKGIASHVGRYTAVGSVDIDLATGEASNAGVTLKAANGDLLFVDLESMPLSPTTSLIIGTITGGTGRFAGASGYYDFFLETVYPSDVLPNRYTGEWRGEISTAGSNQK